MPGPDEVSSQKVSSRQAVRWGCYRNIRLSPDVRHTIYKRNTCTFDVSAFSFTLSLGDQIIQQFSQLLSLEVRNEKFLSFKPLEKRLDVFLHPYISQPYPQLWAFIRNLLLLSHGQATVERGFSINKQVEICNIQVDTVIAQRVVCDYVSMHGGVTKVPLTPELLSSVTSARVRYRMHLESERKKKETQAHSQRRIMIEEELEQLKKTRQTEVAEHLRRDADKMAEEAEGKQGSKMAELIAKSNALRRSYKQKLTELESLGETIATKAAELQRL